MQAEPIAIQDIWVSRAWCARITLCEMWQNHFSSSDAVVLDGCTGARWVSLTGNHGADSIEAVHFLWGKKDRS